MKKILSLIIGLFLVSITYAQKEEIAENTIKKFGIGIDLFTDIWRELPSGIDARTINQGVSVFGMHNTQIGKSDFSVGIGAGITVHNMYTNSEITNIKAPTVVFTKIPDDRDYKRSKVSFTYLDVPLELRYKSKGGFKISAGVKVGYLLNSHTKFKGSLVKGGATITQKQSSVANLEAWRFGPTFRIGYKWVDLVGYYQVSSVIQQEKGPQIAPISIGISLTPYRY
ncbi:MAG: outer membrane beta-barrel protein [Hyphomicrobiales bacterium]